MNTIETVQALVGALRSFIYDGKAEGWDAALTAGDDFLAQAAQSPAPVAVQPSQRQDIAGWKLVPIEPTEEMWTAGRDPIMYRDVKYQVLKSMEAPPWRINPETGKVELDQSKGTAAVHVWRAMIAAAPPLSASPEDKPK